MPQSLNLNTPSQSLMKRQRSQELPVKNPRVIIPGQGSSSARVGQLHDSARQVNVRIPPYLNKTKAKISLAFQELEWKQRFRLQHGFQNPHTSPFRVDRSKVIFNRNRYGNVQPWDGSRVKLRNPIGGSDYINASPIKLKSRAKSQSGTSTPGHSSSALQAQTNSRYIATQGPKEGQYSHFWHMVMQETPGEVGVVIMLTQHVEGHKEKCAQYYPVDMEHPTILLPDHEGSDVEEGSGPIDDGDPFLDSPTRSADTDSLGTDSEASQESGGACIDATLQPQVPSGSVTLLSMHYDSNTGCDVRKLKLTIDGNSKTIYHYFFGGWPDFAKPEAEDRAALLELARVSKSVADGAPRFVHCSAGVGRTGTWIALDFLLQELDAGRLVESPPPSASATPPLDPHATQAPKPSSTWGRSGPHRSTPPPKSTTPDPRDDEDIIFETVNTLREQRMMMVMNELQYQFIYEVLKEAFIEKYAEKETGPVVIEISGPSPKVARKKSPEKLGGMYQAAGDGHATAFDDAEEDSEAETEVMGEESAGGDADMDVSAGGVDERSADDEGVAPGVEVDPYAAVAPETLRVDQENDARGKGRDHEMK